MVPTLAKATDTLHPCLRSHTIKAGKATAILHLHQPNLTAKVAIVEQLRRRLPGTLLILRPRKMPVSHGLCDQRHQQGQPHHRDKDHRNSGLLSRELDCTWTIEFIERVLHRRGTTVLSLHVNLMVAIHRAGPVPFEAMSEVPALLSEAGNLHDDMRRLI